MTWESGPCEPGLEGTALDPSTWGGLTPDELGQLRADIDGLLAQLRAGYAGDELAARRQADCLADDLRAALNLDAGILQHLPEED